MNSDTAKIEEAEKPSTRMSAFTTKCARATHEMKDLIEKST